MTEFFYRTAAVPAWADTKSLELDGTNALASLDTWPGLLSSDSGYSVSFWYKSPTSPPALNASFFMLGKGTQLRLRWYIWYGNGKVVLQEGTCDTAALSTSTNVVTGDIVDDTLWHHYAITSTGLGGTNGLKAYKDGALIYQGVGKPLGSEPFPGPLAMGCSEGFGNFLVGNLDEFSIFSVELPITGTVSVASLYNSGTPQDISGFAGIENYYRMGDGVGDVATLIRDQIWRTRP